MAETKDGTIWVKAATVSRTSSMAHEASHFAINAEDSRHRCVNISLHISLSESRLNLGFA